VLLLLGFRKDLREEPGLGQPQGTTL